MKKLFLCIAGLLAILGLYWWSLGDSNVRSIDHEAIVGAEHSPAPSPPTLSEPSPSPERAAVATQTARTPEAAGVVDFSVQVVESTGTPVPNVLVWIRALPADQVAAPEPSAAERKRLLAKLGTDLGRKHVHTTKTRAPDGIAPIPHIQRPLPGTNPSSFVVVSILIPGLEIADQRVDLDHLPTDAIRFELPEHGSVVVLTHDGEGKPVFASRVELLDLALSKHGLVDQDEGLFPADLIESGRATFAFVKLGLDLSIDATGAGRVATGRGPGPRRAGEQVTFELNFGAPPASVKEYPVIIGRIVDEQGGPLAMTALAANVEAYGSGGGGSKIEHLITDEGGRFRVVLPVMAAANLGGRIRFGKNIASTGPQETEASVTLDSRIHPGENDIGDIVMHGPRFLASGRVVDETGAPVPNALVDGDVFREYAGDMAWRNDPRISGKSAADGSFTITAQFPDGRIRLRASRRGWVDGEIADFVPGSTNVWIALTRSSRIEGHVLLDDVGASTSFWIRAARKTDSADERNLFRDREKTRVKPDGSFLLSDVRPGETDLAILVEGNQNDVVVLEALRLAPGETSSDPRLASLDLRGKIVPTPKRN